MLKIALRGNFENVSGHFQVPEHLPKHVQSIFDPFVEHTLYFDSPHSPCITGGILRVYVRS